MSQAIINWNICQVKNSGIHAICNQNKESPHQPPQIPHTQHGAMVSLSNSFSSYYGNIPQTDFYGSQLGMSQLPHLTSELDKKKRHSLAEYQSPPTSSSFAGEDNKFMGM